MLVSHNAMEILYTPGRVTMLGESDGNRLRRIYTDGRGHPDDGELSWHGHSTGHWEGDTLVVDTVGIYPQAPLAISEAVGVPNNGDMRVVERIHLSADNKDILHVDLEITAPNILTKPWKTTRIFFRQRARKFDIVEGVCVQGDYREAVDKDGFHIVRAGRKDDLGKHRSEISWDKRSESSRMKRTSQVGAGGCATLGGVAAGLIVGRGASLDHDVRPLRRP